MRSSERGKGTGGRMRGVRAGSEEEEEEEGDDRSRWGGRVNGGRELTHM